MPFAQVLSAAWCPAKATTDSLGPSQQIKSNTPATQQPRTEQNYKGKQSRTLQHEMLEMPVSLIHTSPASFQEIFTYTHQFILQNRANLTPDIHPKFF